MAEDGAVTEAYKTMPTLWPENRFAYEAYAALERDSRLLGRAGPSIESVRAYLDLHAGRRDAEDRRFVARAVGEMHDRLLAHRAELAEKRSEAAAAYAREKERAHAGG